MWALKRDFPDLEFSLNGVVQDCHEAAAAIQHEEAGARVHGVMIGRAAYHGPWACLSNADMAVFGAEANAAANRREVNSFRQSHALQVIAGTVPDRGCFRISVMQHSRCEANIEAAC